MEQQIFLSRAEAERFRRDDPPLPRPGKAQAHLEGGFTVDGNNLYRCVKGSLTEAYLMLSGGVEDFDQWTCRTACGVPVLLAVSDAQALILAERKNSFVTVNVFADRESMAREELEAIADTFNWSIIG